jgi:2'-5' RNA ligase
MSTAGESAIIVPLPALDEAVGEWRLPIAEPGLEAHITLLYPFKPVDLIDEDERRALRRILGGTRRQPISFERTSRFPGVLFLVPDRPSRFLHLIDALVERWPSWPPYGGAHAEVIPHATVTLGQEESALDEIEQALQARLPLEVAATEACLITFDGTEWTRDLVVPFAHP